MNAMQRQALRRAEKTVCGLDREDLPPAAEWLRDNARALYGQESGRGLRRREFGRLRAVCDQLSGQLSGPWTEAALCRAVQRIAGEAAPFTVAEARALQGMLRDRMLERLGALLPEILAECRHWQAGRRLAAHPGRTLPTEPAVLCRALDILTASGQAGAVRALQSRMRAANIDPEAAVYAVREQSTALAAETGALIGALKSLPGLHWDRLAERLCAACQVLRRHPDFMRMELSSRALYLSAVRRLSRRTGLTETELCEKALALCAGKEGAAGDPGYYLLEDPRKLGLRSLSEKGKIRAYAALLLLGAALSLGLGLLLLPVWAALPFGFAMIAVFHRLLERAAARFLPRRGLPRLAPACLPREARALVAVPTVLTSRSHALQMCRHLSVLYLANAQAPADFLLLADFTDADQAETPRDKEIVRGAAAGIEALNESYGPRFYYLHRQRTRDADGRYAGRERKRGALELLNALILGEESPDPLVYATPLKRRYTHVITLDADTFLPAGAAEKLLGAALHPLQRGRVTVIQPRMVTLSMHVFSHAQQLLGGQGGADGYGAAAADFYQDVFGRGSFMGKGIYEPAAFRAATARLPQNRVLSHDLIEGELACAALAGDIVCYDGHPRRVAGFLRRAHRWTRGDWQIAGFLGDQKLDLLSKVKIWDNLRRSLTPFARMIALIFCAYLGAYVPFFLLLFPLAESLLLPAGALVRVDAILRALWRMRVSHKRLLEWVTAAQADKSELKDLRGALPPMVCGIVLLFASANAAFWPGFALGLAWLAYPLTARFLDRPRSRREALEAAQGRFLMETARDTWKFFEKYVGPVTRFLPPDNVQVSPNRGAAPRTSPTNMGLYLLSLCAAHALGIIDTQTLLTRAEQTVTTLEKLPCWRGIPYNWYDLRTLAPLPPRVVSSVDAGNYMICLMAAAQALRDTRQPTDAPARLDALCARMELGRLYDKRSRLFHISCDADGDALSAGRYDLLASESQLLSFAAICRGIVPESHWWRLGRACADRRTLLSWSGTAFEYLMAPLLLPTYADTLLAVSQRGCVAAQMHAGRAGYFGVSESGYAQFDPELNYRYRAFGVAELALDPQSAGAVYAPYAAALALRARPRAACDALRAMKKAGAYGECGFYEAIDCREDAPRIVFSFMAHHQGMLLCALCNALSPDYLPRLLLKLPRVQAHLPLLCELPPRRVSRLPRPLRPHRDRPAEPPVRVRGGAALLSGGGTSLLINSRGHGVIFREDIDWTRFDPRAGALSGPQIYWEEEKQAPLRLTGGAYTWTAGGAICALALPGLRSEVRLCVDPLTGAAVYAVKLRNLQRQPREGRLVFRVEPALENRRDYSAHPAFSELFLTIQEEGSGCLLHRQLRAGGERALRLSARSHFLTLALGQSESRTFMLGETLPDNPARCEGLAAARFQARRRMAEFSAEQLAQACQLADRLLYRRDAAAAAPLRELWALGISGDHPLLAVRADPEAGTAPIRQIYALFSWLVQGGARAEMAVLLPPEAGYEQPLRACCEGLPGVRILYEGEAALRAFAAVFLDTARPLAAQWAEAPESVGLTPAARGGALPALPPLRCWNGVGGFTDGGGYLIQGAAPVPWCHILCNESFGTLVCEQGILYSYAGNSRLRRLTRFSQQAAEPAEEYFILENGQGWSLTRSPLHNADTRVIYGMGTAEYQCALPGMEATLCCFADAQFACGGRVLTLRSLSSSAHALTVLGAVRFALGEDGHGTAAEAMDSLVVARGDLPGAAFFHLPGGEGSTAEGSVYGVGDGPRHTNPDVPGSVGLLRRDITLRPGESATLCFWLGYIAEEKELPALLPRLTAERIQGARKYWRDQLDILRFRLPDGLLSDWLGGFLPYQVRASRLFMRAGFWQPGGAWGFRDQLQDMLALLFTEPGRVRAHLLLCASRQYAEGDVQHWWHPGGAGVRTRIADDRLFLPWVLARYVHVTGDSGILDISVPFLVSPPLAEGERDRYELAEPGDSAPLREHCQRAIGSLRYGPHGIPLMAGGDWNDGMNAVGGESAWLGFFLIMVLRDFAPLCDEKTRDQLDRRRIHLQTAMQAAWTGRWFLRAWYADGRTLGAPDSEVPRIDLISQSFAAFAGMPRDQVGKALDAAWELLHRENGVTLLLDPPFTPEEKAGYIGAYPPGVRENGGQYTHALPWFMRALLQQGQTERAWQLLREILPYAHSDTPEKARQYRAEPYVLAADITPQGRGGWTWYTGSAGWLYQVFLCDFLGFDRRGDAVRLSPRLPATWDRFTLIYRVGRNRYLLTAARDVPYITLDGEKQVGAYVDIRDDGEEHEIRFPVNT